MLYLHPPYYSYEGVTLLGDFHNPRQFYYFPNRPHLAVDEQGRPAIRFIVLKEAQDELDENEEDVAGFLVFDTSLAWPQDTLDKVARKLKEDLDLDNDPILAPLPYKSGSVQLTFLDRTTPLPPEPGDEEGGTPQPPPTEPVADMEQPWVPFLKSSGVPALYGENRAIFSVMLNRKATKLLYGAFEGFMPAGVVYNLDYVGMQRAFNVRVEADWEKAYHFVQEQFKADLFIYSHQTDDIIERLEEAKIVKIEASLEGVDDEAMEAEFQDVREQLQDLVLKTFFEPTVNPDKVEQTGFERTSDGIIESARKLRNLGFPNVGYTRREVDISEVRSISADYTMSRAVERSIHPQAHLALFFEDFNLTRDDIVTVVDGNDALWNTASFDAALNADFGGDGIHSVALDVQYSQTLDPVASTDPEAEVDPDSLWSFLFDPQNNRVKRESWYNPEIGNNFFYRYTVFFKSDALPGADQSLSSGWRRQDSQLVVISPHELYEKREIEIQSAAGFPFDRYPQVWVQLAYHDPGTGWKLEDSELLSADRGGFKLAFRKRKQADAAVQYRFSYLRADGGEIEGGWNSTTGDLVLVDDPVPDRLKVRIVVGGDRSRIANLIIDLKYDDAENGVLETGSIIIDPTNVGQLHEWSVALADPAKRRYAFNQTLIDTDGNVTFTDWQQSDKTTLTVGQVFVMQLEVLPELIGPPLLNHNLDSVKLRLRYNDDLNGVDLETERLFKSPGKAAPWQIQLKDAGARDYQYEVVYVLNNGFERTLGLQSSRDNFLMLSSVPPAA